MQSNSWPAGMTVANGEASRLVETNNGTELAKENLLGAIGDM